MNPDHRPVVTTITLKLGHLQLQTKSNPHYIRKLRDPTIAQECTADMSIRLDKTAEHDWTTFKEAVNETARVRLGLEVGPKKEWISDTTWELIQQKRKARLQSAVEEYKVLQKQCRASIRQDKHTLGRRESSRS